MICKINLHNMKTWKAFLIICLMVVLSGCVSEIDVDNLGEIGLEEGEIVEGEVESSDVEILSLDEKYESWKLKSYDVVRDYDFKETDCLYNNDAWVYSGDLLSSMIVDQDYFKDNHRISKYADIEYLKSLDKVVAKEFLSKRNENFYMYQVCSFNDEIDFVVGTGEDEILGNDNVGIYIVKNLNEVVDLSSINVSFNEAYRIAEKGLVAIGGSATGAEPNLCSLSGVEEDYFEWKCFVGLLGNEKDGVIGDKSTIDRVDFDGEILGRDIVESTFDGENWNDEVVEYDI